MEEPTVTRRKSIGLLCLAIFLLLSIGSAMYVMAEIPYFESPDVSGDLLVVISELSEDYSSVSQHLAKYRDVWGAVSIGVGALMAILTTMRASHVFIIACGGFLAVVLGNLQLTAPQKKIDLLAGAQQSLACLSSPYQTLRSAKELYYLSAGDTSLGLNHQQAKLLRYVVRADEQIEQLNEWVFRAQSASFQAASESVITAILMPVPEFSYELGQLESLADEFDSKYSTLQGALYDLPHSSRQTLIVKLEALESRLISVEEIFNKPKHLHKAIVADFNNVQANMVEAKSTLTESQRNINEMKGLLSALPLISEKLAFWPSNIDNLDAEIRTSVAIVHSRLLADLARTGASADDIADLVSSMPAPSSAGDLEPDMIDSAPTPQAGSDGMAAGGSSFVQQQELSVAQQKAYQALLDMINQQEEMLSQLLASMEKSIKKAESLIANFQLLRDTFLNVLIQYNDVLRQYMLSVKRSQADSISTTTYVRKEMAYGQKILSSINFENMSTKVESCV